MSKTKILITGASGFIGTNLLEYYVSQGKEVINVDFEKPRNSEHLPYWKNVDIRDYNLLEKTLIEFNPEYIIHLAAQTDFDGKTLEYYDANYIGTKNVLDAGKKCHNLKRLIFTSSQGVCKGKIPDNDDEYIIVHPYGESKKQAELIVKNDKIIPYEWLIVRPTSIWGAWFGVPYRNFFDLLITKRYFHIGHQSGTKTYGYVGNTVYQLDELLFADKSIVQGKIFYLGDMPPYSIEEWANEIANELNIKIRRCPLFVLKLAAWVGDVLKIFKVHFPMTTYRLNNMTHNNIRDLSKIHQIAPNRPYTRIEGTKTTLKWLRVYTNK
ncbi:NDP-sugar dehydratase or epimerase [Bacteroidia bacterium]|nr:NDP-sugar dehydratase or epimerase [Bacteroidia bacterium]